MPQSSFRSLALKRVLCDGALTSVVIGAARPEQLVGICVSRIVRASWGKNLHRPIGSMGLVDDLKHLILIFA